MFFSILGITLQGVRKLVKGLPALEMISFGSMGKILNSSGDFDDIAEPLKLIHFNELDPECGKKFNLFKLIELFLLSKNRQITIHRFFYV